MQGLSEADAVNVFDLDTATGSPTSSQVAISYQNGRITLPTSSSVAWYAGNHKHLRVFYEGDLDWGVAIQKAPSLYSLGTDGSLGVGQYAVSGANPLHLHFPHCDSGKVVEVQDINYTDQSGSPRQVSGSSGTITTDTIGSDTDYIDLTGFLPDADPTKPVQIGAVRGVSARAVVIWKERTNWKTRALDTILTRTQ